ncbi:similar to secretin RcpA/CpaC [alpha proteobacterium U9-1i]|nr:similar to secretin RcpA/CpaC [alpha proteobacterium U9-1i]
MRVRTMKRKLAGITAAIAAIAFATSAAAQDVVVALDQAFPIRLAAPAQGVAIGNPSIAGVSVQNDQFLFVTGRSYGTTNLVVVGEGGRLLYSGRVTVTPDERNVVMVTRGTQNSARMECTPICRPRPDIGDTAAEALNEQITARTATARGE